MRVLWLMLGILAAVPGDCCAQDRPPAPAVQLVREVVYNELHDHDRHGYWRYWVEHQVQQETRLEQQVETVDGPVKRLVLSNGRPLSAKDQQQEQTRLVHLLDSPAERAKNRKEYAADEARIGRILGLLPDAFLFDDAGEENGCHRLRFRPKPGYPAHSIEARVFHAMSGELWVDARFKRLVRLDGQLQENVDFGFGILGRLYKGGWFRLERTQVSATDWRTERLEVHMSGRAMLFKTIARETSETRGGFAPVPAGMSLAEGAMLLQRTQTNNATILDKQVTPASFAARR
jgi:hypothetical protein